MKQTRSPQEFSEHSIRLLRAYPSSTKVTTTYHASAPGKGVLTLKTYDPVSGVCIKFRTTKVADVGRLITGLHRLGRQQAGLPQVAASTEATWADVGVTPMEASGATTPVPGAAGIGAAVAGEGKKGRKKKGKGKP